MIQNNEENECKVVLLGESFVGKTCIANRLSNDKFEENIEATTSASYWKKIMQLDGLKNIKFGRAVDGKNALKPWFFVRIINICPRQMTIIKQNDENLSSVYVKKKPPEGVVLSFYYLLLFQLVMLSCSRSA